MCTRISIIRKYHIRDIYSGVTIGNHSLVARAKKAFWQFKTALPKYHAKFNFKAVLKLIGNLGDNKTLTMRQLSLKIAYLVIFSTLSLCCLFM